MKTLILLSGGYESAVVSGLVALVLMGLIKLFSCIKSGLAKPYIKLIKKGFTELVKKNYDSAIALFHEAYLSSPTDDNALCALIYLYHLKGDYVKSKAYLDVLYQKATWHCEDMIIPLIHYINGHHFFMNKDTENAKTYKENAYFWAKAYDCVSTLDNWNLY
jgi:outer membrane protein assembly factor BamD (BamD/ComL family)